MMSRGIVYPCLSTPIRLVSRFWYSWVPNKRRLHFFFSKSFSSTPFLLGPPGY